MFDGPSKVNVSHIIHDLSFGPKYPGIKNPLDGTVRILQEDSASFKYFIKVRDPAALSLFCSLVVRPSFIWPLSVKAPPTCDNAHVG